MTTPEITRHDAEWAKAHFVDIDDISRISLGDLGRIAVLENDPRLGDGGLTFLKVYENEDVREVQDRFIRMNEKFELKYRVPEHLDPEKVREFCIQHFRLEPIAA